MIRILRLPASPPAKRLILATAALVLALPGLSVAGEVRAQRAATSLPVPYFEADNGGLRTIFSATEASGTPSLLRIEFYDLGGGYVAAATRLLAAYGTRSFDVGALVFNDLEICDDGVLLSGVEIFDSLKGDDGVARGFLWLSVVDECDTGPPDPARLADTKITGDVAYLAGGPEDDGKAQSLPLVRAREGEHRLRYLGSGGLFDGSPLVFFGAGDAFEISLTAVDDLGAPVTFGLLDLEEVVFGLGGDQPILVLEVDDLEPSSQFGTLFIDAAGALTVYALPRAGDYSIATSAVVFRTER